MNFQWYPGHMTKAKRMMQENIKLIDIIVELVDARIPLSSRNPDIDELGKNKSRIILLNKSDLASDKANELWAEYFKQLGYYVLKINAKSGSGVKSTVNIITEACKEKIARDRRKGILNRPIRAMVVGIPNVGKSTFINSLAGKACTKTGNKPGVTKGKQWIRLNKSVELLDTPGILWPKFDDQLIGMRLALIGSMNDQVLNIEDLALELIKYLQTYYAVLLKNRYEANPEHDSVIVLQEIAQNRLCIKKGNELDLERAAYLLIDDFRSGKIGKITLEMPPEITPEVLAAAKLNSKSVAEPIAEPIATPEQSIDCVTENILN